MDKIHYGYFMPPDFSTTGSGIDQLIWILHIFMIILFVGWGTFLIITLLRYRQREGHKANYESASSKLPKYIEVGVVLFEVFLLVGLSFPIWNRYKADPPPANEALTIRVIGQQFQWNFHYAGKDGKFGSSDPKFMNPGNLLGIDPNDPASEDDFVTGTMNFPVNQPIIAQISSMDVIHSFGVPVLRLKQDATPGLTIPIWFTAKETGSFDIHCSQLCGLGHYRMKGVINVQSPEDYQKWEQEQPRPFKKVAPKTAQL